MNRAKSGSADAAENLRHLVKTTAAFNPHLRPGEPDWEQTVDKLNLSPAILVRLNPECRWRNVPKASPSMKSRTGRY